MYSLIGEFSLQTYRIQPANRYGAKKQEVGYFSTAHLPELSKSAKI
jgi:hypothetical protein